MTSIYINSLELTEPDVILSQRQSTNTWPITNLERTGQSPTTIKLDLTVYGNDRHTIVSSIEAEMKDCERILINGNGKYLYGTKQTIWLSQTTARLTEAGGRRLQIDLNGNLDEDIIHSCDFLSGWSSDATVTLVADSHEGPHSIMVSVGTVGASTTTYTPTESAVLTDKQYLRVWLWPTTTIAFTIKAASAGGYYYWDTTISAAIPWQCVEFALADASISGNPTWAAITSFAIDTITSPTTAHAYKVDGIYAY